MRTCAKRRRPGPPGTSETTRAAIASSSSSSNSILGHVADTSERLERELPAEHGREHQDAVALLREVSEPAGDDVPDALRDRRSWLLRLRPDALESEQAHRLGDEERISLGLLVQRCDELRRGDRRRGQLDVLAHIAARSARERANDG